MTDAVTISRFVRWWPPVGVLAMLVLGLLVGKNSTPIDDWFLRDADRTFGASEHFLLIQGQAKPSRSGVGDRS